MKGYYSEDERPSLTTLLFCINTLKTFCKKRVCAGCPFSGREMITRPDGTEVVMKACRLYGQPEDWTTGYEHDADTFPDIESGVFRKVREGGDR